MSADFNARRWYADAARFAAGPKKLETAERNAVSTLRRRLQPEATRDISGEYNLTAARVRKGLSSRSSANTVALTGSGSSIGIAQGFGGRQTPTGVVAVIKRAKPPVRFRHDFIRTPTGSKSASGPQAFERAGPGAPRYPLDRIFTTTIAGALRSEPRRDRFNRFSQNILAAEVRRQLGIR